jgi:hypothetical protein
MRMMHMLKIFKTHSKYYLTETYHEENDIPYKFLKELIHKA